MFFFRDYSDGLPDHMMRKRANGVKRGVILGILAAVVMVIVRLLFPGFIDVLPIPFLKRLIRRHIAVTLAIQVITQLATTYLLSQYYKLEFFPLTWGGRTDLLRTYLTENARKEAFSPKRRAIWLITLGLFFLGWRVSLIYLISNLLIIRYVYIETHA